MIQGLPESLHKFLWQHEVSSLSWWQQKLIQLVKILLFVGRDLSGGMITLRAMSLVYTTLLSFVPLLAVSFSVLKGFGVHNQIEPFLLNLLEPLGDQSVEITAKIVGFVENMEIGVLGALGLGMLLYTVISLIQKIESAFNFTWRLDTARNFSQRFSNYLSVIMVGPVLIFSALGITASLKVQPVLDSLQALPFAGEMVQLGARLLPYLLIITAFSFVYMLVPNTRVQFKSALYGAVISGILWRWTGLLFASFAADSTSYTAIYSSFAILILFMIWLYIGWLILLTGACIAYYHQHPESLQPEADQLSFPMVLQERLSWQLMVEIGRAFNRQSDFIPTRSNLCKRLNASHTMTKGMLNNLEKCGLIVQVSDNESRYLPGRSIDQIQLIDILRVARNEDDTLPERNSGDDQVSALQHEIDQCHQQVLAGRTLQDLLNSNLE